MKKCFPFILTVLCLWVAGCSEEKEKNENLPSPVILLNGELSITTSYTGGDFVLKYTIQHAESGRPFVDTESEWIEIREVNNTSTSLHVAACGDEARSGEIRFSYPGAETIRISVVQQPCGSFVERVSVSVENVTMTSADIVIHNPNRDLWVCPIIQTKNYYDTQIAPDPGKWVAYQVSEMYKQWRTYCQTSGKQVLFEDFWGITQQDSFSKSFANLRVDSPYVAIGLEIDPFGNFSREMVMLDFNSAPLPPVEKIELSCAVTLAYNAAATGYNEQFTLTYAPSNKSAPYFADLYVAEYLDSDVNRAGSLKNYLSNYLDTYNPASNKFTGDKTIKVWLYIDDPKPVTLKVSVALCGCDQYWRMTSEPIRKDFTIKMNESSTQTL